MKALVRLVKFLHSVSSFGLAGAICAHMVLLITARSATPAEYVAVRGAIDVITRWLLVPSLVTSLLSGLLSIAISRPFQNALWVWSKALLGAPVLHFSLGAVRRSASEATEISAKVAAGLARQVDMAEVLHREWAGLWTVVVLALANIALAVWRPKFGMETR